jgi:hypothetical protein
MEKDELNLRRRLAEAEETIKNQEHRLSLAAQLVADMKREHAAEISQTIVTYSERILRMGDTLMRLASENDRARRAAFWLLFVAIGYAHAATFYTGRASLANLVETLKKSKRRRETLRKNAMRGHHRNGKIDDLLFENEQLKYRVAELRRALKGPEDVL